LLKLYFLCQIDITLIKVITVFVVVGIMCTKTVCFKHVYSYKLLSIRLKTLIFLSHLVHESNFVLFCRPVRRYCNQSLAAVGKSQILAPFSDQTKLILHDQFTGSTIGTHTCCYQTTVDGNDTGYVFSFQICLTYTQVFI